MKCANHPCLKESPCKKKKKINKSVFRAVRVQCYMYVNNQHFLISRLYSAIVLL